MGKDAPSPPPPPDPAATAAAQGAMNRDTAYTNFALSRVNQTSPWGAQTWARNTNDPGGKAWQAYYDKDAQWRTQKDAYDSWVKAGSPADRAVADPGTAPEKPPAGIEDAWTLNTTLSPAQQTMLDTTQRIGQSALDTGEMLFNRVGDTLSNPLSTAGLPDRVMSIGYGRGIKWGVEPTAGEIRYDTGYTAAPDLMTASGPIQRSVNFNGLMALPGLGDFSADRAKVEDALYGRATSRLDPEWQQREADLRTQLRNQGIVEGSAAWSNAMDDLNRARTDAYDTARRGAVVDAGGEQGRLFGQALAGRQQGVNEVLSAGTFANTAQAQDFGQRSADRARFTGEADRVFAANNAAQAQDFQQRLAEQEAWNRAQQQWFGQAVTRDTFVNNARDAALNERATLRFTPINEIRGLMGLGGINAPQFGQVATPQMQAPDYQGAVYNSYAGQMNAWNAQNQASTSMFNGLLGLGGNALMAGATLATSDERAKTDIQQVGVADNGLPIYSYRYRSDAPDHTPRVGVMAQDVEKVRPDAVGEIGGVKVVNYPKALGAPPTDPLVRALLSINRAP